MNNPKILAKNNENLINAITSKYFYSEKISLKQFSESF